MNARAKYGRNAYEGGQTFWSDQHDRGGISLARDLGLDPAAVLRCPDGFEVYTTANPIRFSRTPKNSP